MARRFVRVDLSSGTACDFRPLAVEPGLAMLDPSNGNAKIIARWLGRFAAAPEWEGDSVNFFVQDDQGGRLEEVYCQPATREDLKDLAEELQLLATRLGQIQPNALSEQTLLRTLSRSLRALTDDPLRSDLDDYFFRYRDANGHWRLVWCWGYQRTDQQPAPAVVCTDPDCNLLFLRRPGRKPKCPSCQAALLAAPRSPSHWKRNALLLLLLLLIAGGVYWYRRNKATMPVRLLAEAAPTSPKAGESGSIKVRGETASGPVTLSPATLRYKSSDAKILSVDEKTGAFQAKSPGDATVTVTYPSAPVAAALKVSVASSATAAATAKIAIDDEPPPPPGTPKTIKILSDRGTAVAFPAGSEFNDFRVVAEYPSGMTRLITKHATLLASQPADEAPLRGERGRLFGLHPGQTVVRAEFAGARTQEGLDVTVLPESAKTTAYTGGENRDTMVFGDTGVRLVPHDEHVTTDHVLIDDRPRDFRIDPTPIVITPGDRIVYQVTGLKNGQVQNLGPDEGVRLSVDDPHVAQITSGLAVQALAEGHTTVTARMGDHVSTASLTVSTTDREAVEYHRNGYHFRHFGGRDVVIYPDGRVVSSVVTGRSTVSDVVDVRADRLWIEPGDTTLRRDEVTPPLRVLADVGADKAKEVPAALESLDSHVLVADESQPGRFRAVGYGRTQVRAGYGGREAFANVTVTGSRFLSVDSKLNEASDDFSVEITLRAASDEGAVEYRVYRAGETPPDAWVPSQAADGYRSTMLHSPPIPYGPRNTRYSLMIEARDAGGKSVQQYPFTFRLAPTVERTDSLTPKTDSPTSP